MQCDVCNKKECHYLYGSGQPSVTYLTVFVFEVWLCQFESNHCDSIRSLFRIPLIIILLLHPNIVDNAR